LKVTVGLLAVSRELSVLHVDGMWTSTKRRRRRRRRRRGKAYVDACGQRDGWSKVPVFSWTS